MKESKLAHMMGGFICKYVFPNLKWFERSGLITHIDQLKYQNFEESKDEI